MQENETLEFYKNYVSEEGLIINLEDLLNYISNLDDFEANTILTKLVEFTEKQSKKYNLELRLYDNLIKKRECLPLDKNNYSDNYTFVITENGNQTIKDYSTDLKYLLTLNIYDFKNYIESGVFSKNDLIHILLNLKKECTGEEKLFSDIYCEHGDSMLLEGLFDDINSLENKINIIKEFLKNTKENYNVKRK